MFKTEHSAHLGANVKIAIDKDLCLGCKGSWVQIPPRRPYNQYLTSRSGPLPFPDLLNFPLGTFNSLGAYSAQNNFTAAAVRFEDSAQGMSRVLSSIVGDSSQNSNQSFVQNKPARITRTSHLSTRLLNDRACLFTSVGTTKSHMQSQYQPSGDGFQQPREWGYGKTVRPY